MRQLPGPKSLFLLFILLSSWFLHISVEIAAQQNLNVINKVGVSPDGLFTAVGFSSGELILIDNVTQDVITLRSVVQDISFAATSLAWLSNGSRLAVGYSAGTIEIWDVITQQIAVSFPKGPGIVMSLNWTSDETSLFAVYENVEAILWDVITGEAIDRFQFGMNFGGDLHTDDHTIVVASLLSISIFDISTSEIIQKVETESFEGPVAWNSSGNRLLVYSTGTTPEGAMPALNIRDASTGMVIISLHTPESIPLGGVTAIGWSPDDALIFAGSLSGYISVWDAETGVFIDSIKYEGQIGGLDILPDGSQFVFGGVPNDGQPATVQYAPVPRPF